MLFKEIIAVLLESQEIRGLLQTMQDRNVMATGKLSNNCAVKP
jgi:hypothetical protein